MIRNARFFRRHRAKRRSGSPAAALVAGADGAPDKCRSEKPNAISHFHVDLERIGPRKPVQEGAAKRFADGLASLPGLWSDDMDDPPAMEPIVGGPT